jgi:hypothetical protein
VTDGLGEERERERCGEAAFGLGSAVILWIDDAVEAVRG